ncbi:MAG: ABC transporter permease [Acidiferrobacteraceae bacterium]|jgi:ABC-type dipeptide/oligopeptide/nickel transport system permease component|nr:ABC transporter permease [Acidiferrobacteraceae bacterium]MBT3770216.1 ABC transporter permease [Acidiferrobacteraceae bacterium]MBT3974385.1 ABC transporter permease [Acidiferrobacteraceae bacterium]MBT4395192.1 ABC transporter permease [Acidiferrobacteraceae bacterium]MBT4806686.1 ABC transporter permease [Acidiferrobacteraceae bacterium]
MSSSYLLNRLLLAVPTLAGAVTITFVLLRVVPGDPIAMMTGPGATEADIALLRAHYGLDHSLLRQFVIYLGQLMTGDLGTSISLRQNVGELIVGRLPVTIELVLFAMLTAVSLALALALKGTFWRGRWPERIVDGFIGIVVAIPDFLWALSLILILGVAIPVMPIFGRMDLTISFDSWTNFYLIESLLRGQLEVTRSVLHHMVLPAVSLALPLMAITARVLKSCLNAEMNREYVTLARTRGFGRLRVIYSQALRNALVPATALSGVQFTFLIGGTVLVERIFGYPGIGNMAIDAVINRDLPLIQGLVLTFAVLFIAVNLLIDLFITFLDPRLRHD